MLSVLGFLAVLGPLVIVHEFGHYLFARIFGVKAEVFSVGFGPTIWSRQCGETELRISAVPLGGYVKLLGEDAGEELPPELKERALQRQAAWKRFFIFFGGPLFNFLFAIFVFMVILVIGEPQMSSVVGRVVPGSLAAKVGFQPNDRIVAIDGQPVKKYEDILIAVNESPEKPMTFTVKRPLQGKATTDIDEAEGRVKTLDLTVTPSTRTGYTIYGENTQVGDIPGLFPTARTTRIGISDPKSPAGRQGIETGDMISTINGKKAETWEDAALLYEKLPAGSAVVFGITQGEKNEKTREVTMMKPAASKGMGADLGLHSSELFVEQAVADSPAKKAGIQKGDRLVSIAGQPVRSFFHLRERIQETAGNQKQIQIQWERNGKLVSAEIAPTANDMRDPSLKKTTHYTIGVMPMLEWAEPVTFVERIWNPFELLYRGTERMVVFSWRNLVSLKKMVTGDVSIGTLGGPILIGKLAGESISRGLIAFLTTMALLSVGLGVLNILPIPVLDGGHLLLLGIEAVRGRPLTIRQMEIVQQVGLSLILLLMVVVIRNDIARLPFFD